MSSRTVARRASRKAELVKVGQEFGVEACKQLNKSKNDRRQRQRLAKLAEAQPDATGDAEADPSSWAEAGWWDPRSEAAPSSSWENAAEADPSSSLATPAWDRWGADDVYEPGCYRGPPLTGFGLAESDSDAGEPALPAPVDEPVQHAWSLITVKLVTWGWREHGEMPIQCDELIDVRRLFCEADYSAHHLSKADGWNDGLVLQLTRHRKFGTVVAEAAEKVERLLSAGLPYISIGFRCNGGKQRSIGFFRLVQEQLDRDKRVSIIDTRHLGQRRWCCCPECQCCHPDLFAEAFEEFSRFWWQKLRY